MWISGNAELSLDIGTYELDGGGSFGVQGYAKEILTVVKTTSGQLKNHAKHNL